MRMPASAICATTRSGSLGADEGVGVHAGDAQSEVLPGEMVGDRVEDVLRVHRVDDRAGPGGDADDAPVAAGALQGSRRVDGLVRAVEAAESEVQDAGGGRRRVRSQRWCGAEPVLGRSAGLLRSGPRTAEGDRR